MSRSSIPSVTRNESIAPDGLGGRRDWYFDRPLKAVEREDLIHEATEVHWARFFVLGFVVFDDVFGVRATMTFCVKVRHNGWQDVAGDHRHNTLEREPISTRAESLPEQAPDTD